MKMPLLSCFLIDINHQLLNDSRGNNSEADGAFYKVVNRKPLVLAKKPRLQRVQYHLNFFGSDIIQRREPSLQGEFQSFLGSRWIVGIYIILGKEV